MYIPLFPECLRSVLTLVWDAIGEDGTRWHKTSEFGKAVTCALYKSLFTWNIEILLSIIKYALKGYEESL